MRSEKLFRAAYSGVKRNITSPWPYEAGKYQKNVKTSLLPVHYIEITRKK